MSELHMLCDAYFNCRLFRFSTKVDYLCCQFAKSEFSCQPADTMAGLV